MRCPKCFLECDVKGFCVGCGGIIKDFTTDTPLRKAVGEALKHRSIMDVLHDVADMLAIHRDPTLGTTGHLDKVFYESAANEIRECAENIGKGIAI